MKLSLFVTALAVIATTLPWLVRAEESAPTWTYEEDNEERGAGPTQWGHEFPTCAGKRQSPINIVSDKVTELSGLPLHMSGSCEQYNITQHYDAYKAEVLGGSCAVDYFGKVFRFAQVHFHAPSEHTIDGEAFDAEAHFVHKAKDGTVVVLGVFLQSSDEANDDTETVPYFAKFFESLDGVDEHSPASVALGSFHEALQDLFASGRAFNYAGGLTVPPCSQVVNWWVLETPLALSASDYATVTESLTRIAAAAPDGANARPTQPLNGREVQAD